MFPFSDFKILLLTLVAFVLQLYLTHVALSRSQTNNFKGRQGGQRSDDGSLVTVNKVGHGDN